MWSREEGEDAESAESESKSETHRVTTALQRISPKRKGEEEEEEEEEEEVEVEVEEEEEEEEVEVEVVHRKTSNTIWNPEDEIKLLEGLLHYYKLKKQHLSHSHHPASHNNNININWNEFYCLTKEQLQLAPTKPQLIDKVRKLKTKLRKISSQERRRRRRRSRSRIPTPTPTPTPLALKGSAESAESSDQHQEALLNLYQQIWGSRSRSRSRAITTPNGDFNHGKMVVYDQHHSHNHNYNHHDDDDDDDGGGGGGVARASASTCGPFSEHFRKEVELNLKTLKVSIGQAQLALSLHTKSTNNSPPDHHNV